TIGSHSFIDTFEEQLIGKNIGDECEINVTFPAEYQAENLAGKPAVFKIKLHEIKVRELPAIDDEFAKDVSEFDTLDELKKDIKAKTLEKKKNAADAEVEDALVEKIIEGMKAEIPDAMIDNRVKQMVEDFGYRLQMQGMDLDTYIKYTGADKAEFEKTFRPQAEKQVKIRLALEKIVELEKIEATEEEINKQIEKMAADYNVTVDQVKAAVPASEIGKDLAVNKAIDFVKANAVITEVKEKKAAEKKPAADKKPAAEKKTTAAKKPATDAKAAAEKKPAAKKPAAKKTTKAE
ncbi:MAG: trigger factor, partial [Clostridiales bacterium]|nr:trigger factor [Candidatus Equinaster intestinalis]